MFFVAVLDNGEAVEQAVAIGGGAYKALVVLVEEACERLVGHMGSLGWKALVGSVDFLNSCKIQQIKLNQNMLCVVVSQMIIKYYL